MDISMDTSMDISMDIHIHGKPVLDPTSPSWVPVELPWLEALLPMGYVGPGC